jgi:soluble lytic murein transglycosylase-like protein
MRRFRLAVWLALVVSAQPHAADSAQSGIVGAYAAVLVDFNPRLPSASGRSLAARVLVEADRAHIDARLVVALVAVESSWRPAATSRAGAVGLGQLMPGTAAALGVDPRDAQANLAGTVRHLARLLRLYAAYEPRWRYALALGAYNAGEGAVAHYGGLPPYAETRAYVREVIGLWRRLAGAGD